MTFSELTVGAKFTTSFLDERVKVWEKKSSVSAVGHTPRGKKISQLVFNPGFEVKEVQ